MRGTVRTGKLARPSRSCPWVYTRAIARFCTWLAINNDPVNEGHQKHFLPGSYELAIATFFWLLTLSNEHHECHFRFIHQCISHACFHVHDLTLPHIIVKRDGGLDSAGFGDARKIPDEELRRRNHQHDHHGRNAAGHPRSQKQEDEGTRHPAKQPTDSEVRRLLRRVQLCRQWQGSFHQEHPLPEVSASEVLLGKAELPVGLREVPPNAKKRCGRWVDSLFLWCNLWLYFFCSHWLEFLNCRTLSIV